jgi:hypothetical protein
LPDWAKLIDDQSEPDVTQASHMLHGAEMDALADLGYAVLKSARRSGMPMPEMDWHAVMMQSKRRALRKAASDMPHAVS